MSDSARERGQAAYKKLFGKKKKFERDQAVLDEFTIQHCLGKDRELSRHIEGALHL